MSAPPVPSPSEPGFVRALGIREAIAINMTQMCGIGPFVTIPLMVAAVGGPQAIIGWIVGAMLAIADGLVWAELGAAMPGSGGTYLYLREAFQYRTGRLMPFLFIWSAILGIPLVMSTGVIGLVKYLGYYYPGMTEGEARAASFLIVGLLVLALYRNVAAVGKIVGLLWVVMLISVGAVTLAAFARFDAHLAFAYPPGAFRLGSRFFAGMGSGLVIAVYDYLGYNTVAYVGDELREPGKVMPRAILYSILGMMVIYLTMNVAVVGAVPWREIAASESVGSLVLERAWGVGAARVFTGFIVLTAFASLLAGLLGASRVPYNAAKDGVFFAAFGRLHPRLHFPHIALIVMAAVTALGSCFTLTEVINVLTAVFVLIQSIAQVVALTVLRRRQPTLVRPYRMLLYPLPSIAAGVGWIYVYLSSGVGPMLLSLGWLVAGMAAFAAWARVERIWPFGTKEIREEFLAARREDAGHNDDSLRGESSLHEASNHLAARRVPGASRRT